MKEYALWLPIRVVHEIMGLDAERLDEFHRLAVGLQLIKTRPDLATAASEALAILLGELIGQRRRDPADTTIDVLIAARIDGEHPLLDEEILSFLRVLLPAGGETTTRNLGSLLVGLLNDPEQLDLLRENRDLLPGAIEETLRWESPTQFNYRLTMADVEVEGVRIPAGSGINLCLAAANRDPARYDDPHRFDIRRKSRGHLAFGFGAHLCIGMHLARTEVALAMNAVLDRSPVCASLTGTVLSPSRARRSVPQPPFPSSGTPDQVQMSGHQQYLSILISWPATDRSQGSESSIWPGPSRVTSRREYWPISAPRP